jgi:hypothetical protein
MSPKRSCFIFILIISLFLTCLSAQAEDIRTIHAKSGEVVELADHTTSNTNVTINVSRTTTIPAANGRYGTNINGIYVPPGSSLSLKAWPVVTLNVNGVVGGTSFSSVKIGNVSGDVGTLIMDDIPDGDYDIAIYGESTALLVSLEVTASQVVTSGPDGYYKANASSKGLPPGLYTVTANGVHIADVYLTAASPTQYPSGSSTSTSSSIDWIPIALIAVVVIILGIVAIDFMFRRRKK